MNYLEIVKKWYGCQPESFKIEISYETMSAIFKQNIGDDLPFEDDVEIFVAWEDKIMRGSWSFKSSFLYVVVMGGVERIMLIKRERCNFDVKIINIIIDAEEAVKIELFKKLYQKDYKIKEEEFEDIWIIKEQAKNIFNNLTKRFENIFEVEAYTYKDGIYYLEFEFLRWLIREYMNYEKVKPARIILTMISKKEVILIEEDGKIISILY